MYIGRYIHTHTQREGDTYIHRYRELTEISCLVSQCTATHTLQYAATQSHTTHCNKLRTSCLVSPCKRRNYVQHAAAHCNTLQHTATHGQTLQCKYASEKNTCNTLQHSAALCSTLQHSAALCSTLQHSATLDNANM